MPTYWGLSYFVYIAMEGMLRACNAIKFTWDNSICETIDVEIMDIDVKNNISEQGYGI